MKEFEDDDPMELRAVSLPAGDIVQQASCVIEEFVSIGMSEDELMKLFQSPFYTGTFRMYQELGEHKIRQLIRSCFPAG